MLKKCFAFLTPAAAIFAQDAAQSPSPAGGLSQILTMVVIGFVFFYFILWRPEQKRRKAAEQMRTSLKKGDRVTAMGIVGRIEKINEHTVVLKLVEGKLEILKAAITDVQSVGDEAVVEA